MKAKDWLIFLRWPNLLMVSISQLIMWRAVLLPQSDSFTSGGPNLDSFELLLLALCTVLVTAAGNIVNDIFDRELDLINKPQLTFVGRKISTAQSWTVYWLLNLLGLLVAIVLADKQNAWTYLPLYPLFTLLLWLYAKRLKGTIIIGNAFISLSVACVPLLPVLAELDTVHHAPARLSEFLLFYALLAFLSNILREIVKDAQDAIGDKALGKSTIATKYGIGLSISISRIILTALWVLILFFCIRWDAMSAFVILFLPLCIITWQLLRKVGEINWKLLSGIIKVLMLIGMILLAFLF